MKILVVDDYNTMRRIMKNLLSQLGHTDVDEAIDGGTALQKMQLHKYDYDTLRFKNAFEFEAWIVQQYGGTSNSKQRNDFGLDGKTTNNTPIQVKRSDNIGRNVIDNFLSAVQRSDKKLFEKNIAEGKPIGYIIAFTFGKGAIQEVARLKNHENIIIQLVTVEEIVPIAKKPTLTVEVQPLSTDKKGIHEIHFIATGNSPAGVEFFSWDFDYKEPAFKAEILLDKKGEQTWKFKPGQHIKTNLRHSTSGTHSIRQ